MTAPRPDSNLAARAEVLTRSVESLSTSVTKLAESQAHIKKAMAWTVVGLVLDLLLSIGAFVLFSNQASINDQLASNNSRIERVQTRTSDEVLCPLYKVLIAFEARSTQVPTLTPEEREQRRSAYEIIHQGYTTLGCS